MQTLMRADNKSVNLKTILLIIRGLGITAGEFLLLHLLKMKISK